MSSDLPRARDQLGRTGRRRQRWPAELGAEEPCEVGMTGAGAGSGSRLRPRRSVFGFGFAAAVFCTVFGQCRQLSGKRIGLIAWSGASMVMARNRGGCEREPTAKEKRAGSMTTKSGRAPRRRTWRLRSPLPARRRAAEKGAARPKMRPAKAINAEPRDYRERCPAISCAR